MTMTTAIPANAHAFLDEALTHCAAHPRFDRAERVGDIVTCHATDTPDEAQFCIEVDHEGVWLTWASTDRYLSQSIEAELMFTGDDLDDMVDEEIVDTGWDLGKLTPNTHYRDNDMRFVFRWKTPIDPGAIDAKHHAEPFAKALAGVVEAFAELGDMSEDDED
ncbi:MAG: hypothetical protein Tsb0013_20120 [Phycisphaerales bacterium]